MKALILGAGYGKRLQESLDGLGATEREKYAPFVDGKPKPLVAIAGKPLLEYLLEKMEKETSVTDVHVIANATHFSQYTSWHRQFQTDHASSRLAIHLFDNGNTTNSAKGVMNELCHFFAITNVLDDFLILAGDTLFDMSFKGLITYGHKRGNVTAVYPKDRKELHRRGVVLTDYTGRVLDVFEKQASPPIGHVRPLAAPIAYFLSEKSVRLFAQVKPNHSLELNTLKWLISAQGQSVYTFEFTKRFDIGTIQDYIEVDKVFRRRGAK